MKNSTNAPRHLTKCKRDQMAGILRIQFDCFLITTPKTRPRNAIRENELSTSLSSSKSMSIMTLKKKKGRRQTKAGVSIHLRR